MNGKKELLANMFYSLGFDKLTNRLRSTIVQDVRIIAYHRICSVDDLNDKELVSADRDEFERQICHIKKNYNAITFAQLIDCINTGGELKNNPVIITFDDGFSDNYYNAFPILKKHNIPATIFISTGYISQGKTFWFNLLSRMIKSNAGSVFFIKDKQYEIPEDKTQQDCLVEEILMITKSYKNSKRLMFIDDLVKQLDYCDQCDKLALPMSWHHVKEMHAAGIEFGSHSVSHPNLSQVNEEELEFELEESKRKIEKELGEPIQTIAYPIGMNFAFNNRVIIKTIQAGYTLGVTYISGANRISKLDQYQLKRLHIERYVNFKMFCSMLALPEIFG